MVRRYKSWKALKNQLEDLLCSDLNRRVTYFLTRYHKVHDSYGRAAVLLDGKELVCFSWIEMYNQEYSLSKLFDAETRTYDADKAAALEKIWDNDCVYCDMDFLTAALEYIDMPIHRALQSENSIIKMFAVMDRRVGKRTLRKLKETDFPEWVRQFYRLRVDGIQSRGDL